MGPLLPAAVTLIVGVVLGARGKNLLQAAGRPVGRVARPALRATIRESLLLSREVQRIAESAREDIEDLTAEARQDAATHEASGGGQGGVNGSPSTPDEPSRGA